MKTHLLLWIGCLSLSLAGTSARAASLKSATVIDIYNQVTIGKEAEKERPASLKDTVAGKDLLRTGKKSRAELEFSDKSLARLGSNTVFSFDPESRQMKIDRGSALIHVPPGQSGARISTPAATVGIMGDVVAMRVNEKGVTQVVALSKDQAGPIIVTFNKTGEQRTLQPGEVLTIDPMDVRIPEPMVVAVDVFVQTSTLLGAGDTFKSDLPATATKEVRATEQKQLQEVRDGNLEGGNRLVAGTGTTSVADTSTLTGGTSIDVQATTGHVMAGRYTGRLSGAGASNGDPIEINIQADGTFAGWSGLTTRYSTFSGTASTDGTFRCIDSEDGATTGTFQFGQNSVSGTYTSSTAGDSGTYSATK